MSISRKSISSIEDVLGVVYPSTMKDIGNLPIVCTECKRITATISNPSLSLYDINDEILNRCLSTSLTP